MEDVRATVESVDLLPHPYFLLRLRASSAFADTRPGQFVMVQTARRLEPFLRRAFSVHDVSGPADVCGPAGVSHDDSDVRIDLLGKVIGPGTEALSRARIGASMQVLGPLGRGFDLEEHSRVALVAGGVGSAPLLILARALLRRERLFDIYYGGRSAVDLSRWKLFAELAEESGGRFVATTEDGSQGLQGLVTPPLEAALSKGVYDFMYACGPMPLLAALAGLGDRYGVAGEAALETPMGCGYGACLGCAVPHVDGRWALCCKEGPVFRFSEVRW